MDIEIVGSKMLFGRVDSWLGRKCILVQRRRVVIHIVLREVGSMGLLLVFIKLIGGDLNKIWEVSNFLLGLIYSFIVSYKV